MVFITLSRPARARGLKRVIKVILIAAMIVAPRAGAWIETRLPLTSDFNVKVAPRAGAWIETPAGPYPPAG